MHSQLYRESLNRNTFVDYLDSDASSSEDNSDFYDDRSASQRWIELQRKKLEADNAKLKEDKYTLLKQNQGLLKQNESLSKQVENLTYLYKVRSYEYSKEIVALQQELERSQTKVIKLSKLVGEKSGGTIMARSSGYDCRKSRTSRKNGASNNNNNKLSSQSVKPLNFDQSDCLPLRESRLMKKKEKRVSEELSPVAVGSNLSKDDFEVNNSTNKENQSQRMNTSSEKTIQPNQNLYYEYFQDEFEDDRSRGSSILREIANSAAIVEETEDSKSDEQSAVGQQMERLVYHLTDLLKKIELHFSKNWSADDLVEIQKRYDEKIGYLMSYQMEGFKRSDKFKNSWMTRIGEVMEQNSRKSKSQEEASQAILKAMNELLVEFNQSNAVENMVQSLDGSGPFALYNSNKFVMISLDQNMILINSIKKELRSMREPVTIEDQAAQEVRSERARHSNDRVKHQSRSKRILRKLEWVKKNYAPIRRD